MEPIDLVCLQVTSTQRVDLTPEEFGTLLPPSSKVPSIYHQITHLLEKKIKSDVEGKCCKHGLVLKGSVEVLTREVGYIPKGHFNGNFVYNVTYKYLVCNPSVGVIIPCEIMSRNQIGYLAHFVHFLHQDVTNPFNHQIDEQFKKYPIVIKIPNELHPDESQQQELKQLQPTDIRYVKVLGKKFELEDKQISVVAKLSSPDAYDTQLQDFMVNTSTTTTIV